MKPFLILFFIFFYSFYIQAQNTPIRLIARYGNYFTDYGILVSIDSAYWIYSGKRGDVDEVNNRFDIRVNNAWDTLGNYSKITSTSTFAPNDSILSTITERTRNGIFDYRYKTLYLYDANYNGIETIYYNWLNNAWQNSNRVLKNFDGLKRLTQVTNQVGSGTQWSDRDRTSYTYYGNSSKLTSYVIEQNSIIGLRNSYKYEYVYDTYQNVVSESYFRFDTASWKKEYDKFYGYDGNNRLIWESRFPFNNSYRDSSFLVYDSNGNNTSVYSFYFKQNKWVPFFRTENTFNINNKIVSQVFYSGDTLGWKQGDSSQYNYNAQNLEYESMFFKMINGSWTAMSKVNSTYDNRQNRTQRKVSNIINGQSPGSSYDDRTYNQYNLITSLKLSSIYNGILSKKSDITYVYDTNQYPLSINNVHLKNVSTFPNPFSSSFSISYESNIATDVSMDLYDAKGALITKTISTANVGENTITWDCGKTLPSGIYTYELRLGNETHSGKIIAR